MQWKRLMQPELHDDNFSIKILSHVRIQESPRKKPNKIQHQSKDSIQKGPSKISSYVQKMGLNLSQIGLERQCQI